MKKILYILIALLLPSMAISKEVKPKLMWLDCSANWVRFSYPDSIKYYVAKCKDAGITHLILDVKGTSSEVSYKSDIAPEKRTWKGFTRPNFDFVNTFISEAHANGMKIFASFNVFCEGHGIFKKGILYDTHKHWQSINYVPGKGLVKNTEIEGRGTAFTNPALKEVQDYELSIIKEVVGKFNFDGVMLDRTRYDNIQSDFSEFSRNEFEKYIGKKLTRFPEDIYEWVKTDKGYTRKDGPYFKEWIEWRASVIYGFFKRARKEVKAVNPKATFAAYTGAWYPSYYEVGVNWASKKYDPSKDFAWATKKYKKYAYAELLDFYTNGNYYWNVTLDEYYKSNGKYRNETDSEISVGDHLCVEGGCKYSRKLLKGAVPFCGGMYVEDYKNDANQFRKAVEMNLRESDGLMIFDIVHIINRNWWDVLKQGIDNVEKTSNN